MGQSTSGGSSGGSGRQPESGLREGERGRGEERRREDERRERERREREQRQRESDDADKRRAEEQARAQREAEERQRQQRERERAEEARLAAEERNEQFGVTPRQVSTTPPPADTPDADKQRAAEIEAAAAESEKRKTTVLDADKQRAAEIEAAQRQAEGRAIDERQRLKAEPTSTSLEGYERRLMEAQERAEFVSGDKSFVTSGTGEKETRVTGGRKGEPVLTRQGVERKAAFEQEELERLVSLREGGEGDPEEGKRNLAKQIIEEKLAADPTLPAGLKAIREINLRNQLKNLEKGGTPTFRIGPGGEFTTSGVLQPGEEGTGIAPNITSDLETMMDEREQEEQPTILRPEPEPEPEPDDVTAGALGVATAPRGRRGTRAKRPGAGGTLLEGGGVLYD